MRKKKLKPISLNLYSTVKWHFRDKLKGLHEQLNAVNEDIRDGAVSVDEAEPWLSELSGRIKEAESFLNELEDAETVY